MGKIFCDILSYIMLHGTAFLIRVEYAPLFQSLSFSLFLTKVDVAAGYVGSMYSRDTLPRLGTRVVPVRSVLSWVVFLAQMDGGVPRRTPRAMHLLLPLVPTLVPGATVAAAASWLSPHKEENCLSAAGAAD